MPIMQQFSPAVNNNSTGNNYSHHKNINNNNNNNNNNKYKNTNPSPRNHLHSTKMQTAQATAPSPPEFDFNLPCRYFKSSFARSLSLNSGGGGGSQCKSLDFDVGHYRSIHACGGGGGVDTKSDCPPLPQRTHAGTATTTTTMKPTTANVKNEVERSGDSSANQPTDAAAGDNDIGDDEDATRPPAIPARCPIKPAPVAAARDMHLLQQQRQQQQQQQQLLAQFRNAAGAENAKPKPPPPNAVPAATAACGNFIKPINHTQQQQVNGSSNNKYNNNNNNNSNNSGCGGRSHSRSHTSNIRRNIWPRDDVPPQQAGHSSGNAAADEDAATPNYAATTSARCMPPAAIVAAATSTTPTTTTTTAPQFKTHENPVNVEVVVLQNQVDTLQWQLKQVETSCDMYRAVIEEVARFLDRYHSQKQQQQQQQQLQQQQQQRPSQLQPSRCGMEQISRSKSLYQVYGVAGAALAAGGGHEKSSPASGDEASATAACLRARSSTNLATPETATRHATLAADRHQYDAITPVNSYSAFKDFTWRRSPKKQSESKAIAAAADLEQKLNQEAFRLSRTIHNLLNTSTQQPDLTQHRNQLASLNLSRLGCNKTAAPTVTSANSSHNTSADHHTPATLAAANNNTKSSAIAKATATSKSSSSLAAEMLFLRSNNMRDSRLSLRSSTDSSVHSTTSSSAASSASSSSSSSSSKVETDEEATPHFHSASSFMASKQLHHPLGSATEDESGFSSISSFQDIGVPLSSTLLSNGSSTPSRHSLASIKLENSNPEVEHNLDSRNSTLKATPPIYGHISAHPTNVVGVPLQATHDMQHRWDSPLTPTKTYRNAGKYQRFSTLSNEESATVLWV